MSQEGFSPIMTYGGDDDISGGFCSPGYELSVVKTVLVIIVILWLLGAFKNKELFYIPFQKNAENRMRDSYRDTPASAIYDQSYLSYPNQLSNA